jgi:hypothetical protein
MATRRSEVGDPTLSLLNNRVSGSIPQPGREICDGDERQGDTYEKISTMEIEVLPLP